MAQPVASRLLARLVPSSTAAASHLVTGRTQQRQLSGHSRTEEQRHDDEDRERKRGVASALLTGASAVGVALFFAHSRRRKAYAKEAPRDLPPLVAPHDPAFQVPERKDLPVFKRDDIKAHGKGALRIWVTYKMGVYDVTDFVDSHPGGDKILMAAGGAVDPFWALYAQHKTLEVMEVLEELRVGSLDPTEPALQIAVESSDPFSTDPPRHPALVINNAKPFNAETPPSLLMDSFRTPNDLFFVRNHLPVPTIEGDSHRVRIEGLGVKKEIDLSVAELKKKYKEHYVTSAVQCSGNRRADMQKYKKVAGLMWEGYAISNAKWTGVRLKDVLIDLGVDPDDESIKHVHLEGADVDPTGKPYGASIPFEKAMQPEVLIAYSMNDEDIPRDHGYPLRLVVPGVVGARQVKWLSVIRLSDVESPSHFQQKDYRAFPPSVQHGDELNWSSVPSIQDYPIQSAFCKPSSGHVVDRADGTVDVAGYAWSGGGKGIIRVEVSPDGGKTWYSAELQQDPEQTVDKMWAWSLFTASIPIPKEGDSMDIVVKATDRSYNTQPETAAGIWNVRGLLHNAWHHVAVKIRDP